MCSEVHRPPSDPQCTAILELQIAAEVEHGGDQAWSQSIMHRTLLRSLLDVMDVVMLRLMCLYLQGLPSVREF